MRVRGLAVAAAAMAMAFATLPPGEALAQDQTSAITPEQADALIAAGQWAEAYERLAALEPQAAGQPDFDYRLGIAALRAGYPTRAVFALERVLAVQPDHQPARLAIAEAYFAHGETQAAEEVFRSVDLAQVPQQIRLGVERYLTAIEDGRTPTRYAGFVAVGAGYDGNLNSGTDASSIVVPALAFLGPAQLGRDSQQQDGAVATLSAGGTVEHRINDTLAALGAVQFSRRDAVMSSDYDTDSADASIGLRGSFGDETIIGSVQTQRFWLDTDPFRDTVGGTISWRHAFSDTTFAGVYGQYFFLNYHGVGQDVRDADRGAVGLTAAHAFGGAWQPVGFAQAYVGQERPRANDVPQLGHVFRGFQLGVEATPMETVEAYGTLAFEERDYGGQEALFLVSRADYQTILTGGARWEFMPDWTLNPEVQWTQVESNVALNDYDRLTALVTVRYDF